MVSSSSTLQNGHSNVSPLLWEPEDSHLCTNFRIVLYVECDCELIIVAWDFNTILFIVFVLHRYLFIINCFAAVSPLLILLAELQLSG